MKTHLSSLYTLILIMIGVHTYAQDTTNLHPVDEFTYQEHSASVGPVKTSFEEGKSSENNTESTVSSKSSSSEAGETSGSLAVSLTGGATYSVPIAVPPGIGGVTPEIAIAYNSQGGNGTIAKGWNISGLSTITKIPSTNYHDGIIDPVDFDKLDRFALDGQRLLLKSGTYGGNGAEYQTENFSNMRITSHGTSVFGADFGPYFFMIRYPDGSIAKYGENGTSRSHLEYALTFWENPQGIRISYEYERVNNVLQIKTISYGSKGSAPPINEIRFLYESRKIPERTAVFHNEFTRKTRPSEISVYGNGTRYRNYELKYKTTISPPEPSQLYTIQEWNGDKSKSLNPIEFSYGVSNPGIDYALTTSNLGVVNIEQRNARVVSLDLTGNGNMDFMVYPTIKDKFWVFKGDNYRSPSTVSTGGRFENIFPTTWLNHQNKILSGQGFTVVQNSNTDKVKFKMYSNGITSPVLLQYEKTWNAPTYSNSFSCSIDGTKNRVPQQYISGDFNGDGLTDVIAISKAYSQTTCRQTPPPPGQICGDTPIFENRTENDSIPGASNEKAKNSGNCCECASASYNTSNVSMINLDRRITSGFATNTGRLNRPLGGSDRVFGADVNGDGKTDIMHASAGRIDVYTIIDNSLTLLWSTNSSYIKNDHPILLGDYNGDGKTDFITPAANNSKLFHYFYSASRRFGTKSIDLSFTFKKSYSLGGTSYGYDLIPVDMNGDGKTDIITYDTETFNSSSEGIQEFDIYYNSSPFKTNDYLGFRNNSRDKHKITGNLKHYPVPVFLSSQRPNYGLEFATISNKWIHSFRTKPNAQQGGLLKNITNNGVEFVIDYNNLEHIQNGTYQKGSEQVYPYVDIVNASNIKIVSSIERKVKNIPTVRQTFYYKGAVSHVQGLGFQGFQYLSRSNWHTGNSDRIFTNTTQDISLRGAVTDEYQTPFTQRFGTIPSDYIYKTKNSYEHSLSSNKMFKIWTTSSTTQNQIDGTSTTRSFKYDIYNNPTKEIVNYSGHGSKVTEITYANNTGANYYIGRPTKNKTTTTVGSNNFSTEERLSYTGSLVTSKQTKGNGTQFDTETYTYDSFGNRTKTTITPYGETARAISATYDPSGRFLTTSTDVEGLKTTFQFDPSIGVLMKETNPYGQETNYLYDTWNRLINETDFLGNQVKTSYTASNNEYTVTTTSDDGSAVASKFDPIKRMIYQRKKSLGGNWIQVTYQYDALNRISGISEPHFGNAPSQWNTSEYDFYGRIKKQNLYTGRSTTYAYSGLTTSVNDGTKTVTTTVDAMGNVTNLNDPGGTIRYSYFGNGNLKSSTYEGTTQTIEQDGWGRKTKLTDPSAGVYTYVYNGFGEVTKETTPKGTTNYVYSTTGRVLSNHTKGDLTDMITDYNYDSSTKLLNRIRGNDLLNSKTYNYFYYYDEHLRLQQLSESTGTASFSKVYQYDQYSRIKEETYDASLSRRISSTTINYNYDAHGVFTGFDNWNIKKLNAREQITEIQMGTGDIEKLEYDTYGYLKKQTVRNESSTTNYIENIYSFNAERGTLASRSHKTSVTGYAATYNESFQYDVQDRLTKINGPFAKTNTYDPSGRITDNSEVGAFNYQQSNKRYQLRDISLNDNGREFYQNRAQQVTYNAFKKPVEVNEEGKGRVTFQYGPMGNRIEAWYGGLETKKEDRKYHKYYSSIMPSEIINNKEDNSYKFIFYKGGDAYSAPMATVESAGVIDNYYLQRDYLGSILNITKEVKIGNEITSILQERRQFGAWGTVDAFWSRDTGTTMGYDSLLGRGYTGHEHFFDLGLIHMNGRMYDPQLGRFLSPDNYIQDPYNTQNYNRYSYVLNNPLMYNDPSGEYGEGVVIGGAAIAAAAIMVGSVVADRWDAWGIKDWWNNGIGKWQPFKNLFGGGKDDAPKAIERAQTSVSSDPLISPNPSIPTTFTSGGESDSGNCCNWGGFFSGVYDSIRIKYEAGIGVGLGVKVTKLFHINLDADLASLEYYSGRDRLKLKVLGLDATIHAGRPKTSLLDLELGAHVVETRFNNVFSNLKKIESPDFERFDFLKGKAVISGGLKEDRFSFGGEGSILRKTNGNPFTFLNGRPVTIFSIGNFGTADLFDETDVGGKFKTPVGKISIGVNFIDLEEAWKSLFNN